MIWAFIYRSHRDRLGGSQEEKGNYQVIQISQGSRRIKGLWKVGPEEQILCLALGLPLTTIITSILDQQIIWEWEAWVGWLALGWGL